jgi:hypothetical protein
MGKARRIRIRRRIIRRRQTKIKKQVLSECVITLVRSLRCQWQVNSYGKK